MKTVYDSCVAADVQIPDEVNEFFSWDVPDDKGVVIDLKATASVSEYKGEFEQGFEIDLGLVPSDVKIIRFYQSC